MRRKAKKKFEVLPDSVHNSLRLSKFINQIMKQGKKSVARKVVYGALDAIKEQLKTDSPIEIFESAIRNVAPVMEVRSKRVGGANYQVPVEVRPDRRNALAIRWIIEASRSKKGAPMSERLAVELISASKNEGEAIKKRENTHKMAEANKAFAHFSW